MITRDNHFDHDGYTVYENSRAKKRYFIFRDELGFGDGMKKEQIVIQVLRPKTVSKVVDGIKTTVHDMDTWHFAKRYVPKKSSVGLLERVIWPPVLSHEIAQAIINVGGKEKEVVDANQDLAKYGI